MGTGNPFSSRLEKPKGTVTLFLYHFLVYKGSNNNISSLHPQRQAGPLMYLPSISTSVCVATKEEWLFSAGTKLDT